jgi:hypothetical protein
VHPLHDRIGEWGGYQNAGHQRAQGLAVNQSRMRCARERRPEGEGQFAGRPDLEPSSKRNPGSQSAEAPHQDRGEKDGELAREWM